MPHKGYKFNQESREKMAAAQRGHRHSPETRAKMSAAHLGRTKRNVSRVANFDFVYSRVKYSIMHRGFSFTMSREEFRQIASKPCFYCGDPPSRISRRFHRPEPDGYFLWNGIDRVDNSLGYVPGNLVTCCARCNRMKSDVSFDDFIDRVTKIYRTHRQPSIDLGQRSAR